MGSMIRGLFFVIAYVFCLCSLSVIHAKSTNSVKVWLIFDRTVDAETWWNTLAEFFRENFIVGPAMFSVCKEFDSFTLVGPQKLRCGFDNVELYSNWSEMEFVEKSDLFVLMREDIFYNLPYVVVVVVKLVREHIFMDPFVTLAKFFHVSKLFIFQDQTDDDVRGNNVIPKGMFYRLKNGKLTNEDQFFHDVCHFILTTGFCDATPNDKIKCQRNITEMAVRPCQRKELVTCDEKKCNCDEMFPWPSHPSECKVWFPGSSTGRNVYSRNVTRGSHCHTTKEIFEVCKSPRYATTENSIELKKDRPVPNENKPTIHQEEKSIEKAINILYVLVGLCASILIVVVVVSTVFFIRRQKPPEPILSYPRSLISETQNSSFVSGSPNEVPISTINISGTHAVKTPSTASTETVSIGTDVPSSGSVPAVT